MLLSFGSGGQLTVDSLCFHPKHTFLVQNMETFASDEIKNALSLTACTLHNLTAFPHHTQLQSTCLKVESPQQLYRLQMCCTFVYFFQVISVKEIPPPCEPDPECDICASLCFTEIQWTPAYWNQGSAGGECHSSRQRFVHSGEHRSWMLLAHQLGGGKFVLFIFRHTMDSRGHFLCVLTWLKCITRLDHSRKEESN